MTDPVIPARTVLEWDATYGNFSWWSAGRWMIEQPGKSATFELLWQGVTEFNEPERYESMKSGIPSLAAAQALAQSLQDALDGFTYEAGVAEGKRLAIEVTKRNLDDEASNYSGAGDLSMPQIIRDLAEQLVEAIDSNNYVTEDTE
jgi:hypothetical protein